MGLTARDYYTKDLIDEFFDNSYNKTACCKCDIYFKSAKKKITPKNPIPSAQPAKIKSA